jgi:hypothetical protein
VARPLANLVPVLISADPIPGGAGLTEIRIVQPMLGLRAGAFRDRVILHAQLNGEGFTIESGELGLGDWGEGFIDRRHPHTYVHELMLVVADPSLGARDRIGGSAEGFGLGVLAGKGFVPFGTDDPMSRPPVRYPVNHHWSQILERAVVAGQAAWRWIMLEGALFNGDEPETPSSWPNLDRFGDSWSLRGTVEPGRGVEVQVSRASVHSPEHRAGAGLDQDKWSASLRAEGLVGARHAYGLVEWARTDEASGAFRFESWLGEGAISLGRARPYMRLESTVRPEEERTSAFRSRRPHLENSILGASRWTSFTGGVSVELLGGDRISVAPLAEGTIGKISKHGEGLFQVADWYSRAGFWTLTIGLRASYGMRGHRMGRYGLAEASASHGVH